MEPLQIVCGAQNFNAGDKIPVAMIGAEFGDFKIKKSKLRGVTSYGMNCSARAGPGLDHDGIMILPADAPVGTPFAEYMKLSDTIIDLEITPNRPDCLSVEGLAREVGAMYRTDVRYPSMRPDGRRRGHGGPAVDVTDRGRGTLPALHGARHPRREGRPQSRTGSSSASPRPVRAPSTTSST
jgi:phenylalanyl-tRNA synthetase beta chain